MMHSPLGTILRAGIGTVALAATAAAGAQSTPDSTRTATSGPDLKRTIAVLPLRPGNAITQADAELITDRLNAELFRTGRITLLERDQIKEILKEQGFQNSGTCNDEACLVQVGQILGVQEIISGSVGQLGKLIMVNLRTIDVATGRVLKVVSRDIQGRIEDVITYLPGISRELVGLKRGTEPPRPMARAEQEPSSQTQQQLRPAKNTAMIAVTSQPDSADVFLDGKRVGVTPYANNLLTPREYEVSVSRADYETYTETVDPDKGEAEEVNIALVYRYGRLEVTSTPSGAAVTIDKKQVGTTPYRNDRVAPATYALGLTREGYGPVQTKISVEKNQLNAFSYALLSSTQIDSAKAADKRHKARRRWARRVVFGLFAAGAWTGGLLLNARAAESLQKEGDLLAAYQQQPDTVSGPISASEYEQRWNAYRDRTRKTDNLALLRNITYGVAGGFSFFLVLSIPF